MRKYKSHIKTSNSIIIVFNEGSPAIVTKESTAYAQMEELLNAKMFEDAAAVADISLRVERQTKGKFQISKDTGMVVLKDEELPTALADRLVLMVKENLDTKALEKFWTNLKENPSQESRKDLYDFLMANKIPLTEDGCFLAYKKVTTNYLDHQTGKLDNRPGARVSMDREGVDQDRHNTCSSGLHVAAFAYAWGFNDGNLLEVKVNPAHVVAVPVDYNQQKMRVCEYVVIGHASTERHEQVVSVKIPKLSKKIVKAANAKAEQKLKLDNRGRLQVPQSLIHKVNLNNVVAVRVDKRSPHKVRITPFNGRGLAIEITRLGVYVPKALLTLAGLGNLSEFKYTFEHGGLSITR